MATGMAAGRLPPLKLGAEFGAITGAAPGATPDAKRGKTWDGFAVPGGAALAVLAVLAVFAVAGRTVWPAARSGAIGKGRSEDDDCAEEVKPV
mmetsp:Transcript_22136/g.50084  ORF Transcript_22136/g.50084 Transcript_22136/m.50084 type:complete len:93 (-) Transcript_22136:141-419(-)